MRVTLLRHCEVIEQYRGKYNGHLDIALSPQGLAHAKSLAKEYQIQNFSAIYCSDLIRSKETLNALNLSAPTFYTYRLREKSWGRHEGKSFEEITQEGILYKDFIQWIEALDGERFSDYKYKLQNYFSTTILNSGEENILVVTHSGVIKTLLSISKGISLEEAFSEPLEYGKSIVLNDFSRF